MHARWTFDRFEPGRTLGTHREALGDRLPGNIHAGQDLDILRLPAADDPLTTTLTGAETSLTGGRRRVAFDTVPDPDTPGRFAVRVVRHTGDLMGDTVIDGAITLSTDMT